ncbi:MAG TPA: amidohydrolase family protein [Chloroflexota bacterium]|jgi:hypothetical protein
MLRAIDVHTHLNTPEALAHDRFRDQRERYFPGSALGAPLAETAAMYRQAEMKAIILPVNKESSLGEPFIGNDYVADVVRRFPDVFVGFAGADPWQGQAAVNELERAVTELGLKGLKLVPPTQAFFPNDRRFYPLYAKCVELDIPIIFHTGHSGIGVGMLGGGGIRLKYCQPIFLDDVAADFPDLTIIGAHPSWPWHDEMLSVMLHKANVYMDLSGWRPKYFPQSVVQYANTLLQDKMLFGTDYPALTPQRWLDDFAAVPFRDAVRPKILLENARRVLKLDD